VLVPVDDPVVAGVVVVAVPVRAVVVGVVAVPVRAVVVGVAGVVSVEPARGVVAGAGVVAGVVVATAVVALGCRVSVIDMSLGADMLCEVEW
jgi:hypothetical protein